MHRHIVFSGLACMVTLGAGSYHSLAQETSTPPSSLAADDTASTAAPENSDDVAAKDLKAREAKLAAYLSGAKFIGKFTIDGKEDRDPKTEEYTISKCEKLPAKNMYRLTARIKYGDTDQEVPLDLQILWAGRTPVITMDNFWIPTMGTFGARVLIHSNRYTGTWQHDAVGGHMFGKIVPKPES